MTKDELNGILKEDEMYLSPVGDGTFNDFFYVLNEGCVVVEFNGVDFIFSRDYKQGYWKKTVEALIEYANTPIEERKPKPQLYNIIIAQDFDVDGDKWYTTWRKEGADRFLTDSCTTLQELNNDAYQFTQEEIDNLKSELPGVQKKIVDFGVTPVG